MSLNIDLVSVANYLISGFIGLIFGALGSYITYRLDKKRTQQQWDHERQQQKQQWEYQKQQLERQFAHEKEKLAINWTQKMVEFETQSQRRIKEEKEKLSIEFAQHLTEQEIEYQQKRSDEIRKELTKGLDNPGKAIKAAMSANTLKAFDVLPERINAGSMGIVGIDLIPVSTVEISRVLIEDIPHRIVNLNSLETSTLRSSEKYFTIRVKGDSMDKAGINDKDYVLARMTNSANSGDIVVAHVFDGVDNQATIKVYKRTKENIVLEPFSNNPKHKPIVVGSASEDFRIIGIANSVLKPMN